MQQAVLDAPRTGKTYLKEFGQADKDNDGVVSPQEALAFFSKSKLPKKTLSQIWKATNDNGCHKLPQVRPYAR